jgi:hypothetical protein
MGFTFGQSSYLGKEKRDDSTRQREDIVVLGVCTQHPKAEDSRQRVERGEAREQPTMPF